MADNNYTLPNEVAEKVFRLLDHYPSLRELADQSWEFEDYLVGITAQYDRIQTSPTNSVSKKTEELAILHADQQLQQKRARDTIRAIDNGILRAAWTAQHIENGNRIKEALTDSLIFGIPRERLDIDPRTLTAYRRKAIYFIAVEMGYVTM